MAAQSPSAANTLQRRTEKKEYTPPVASALRLLANPCHVDRLGGILAPPWLMLVLWTTLGQKRGMFPLLQQDAPRYHWTAHPISNVNWCCTAREMGCNSESFWANILVTPPSFQADTSHPDSCFEVSLSLLSWLHTCKLANLQLAWDNPVMACSLACLLSSPYPVLQGQRSHLTKTAFSQ